jgi:hypothetical protein
MTRDRAICNHGHYYQPPRPVCQITRRRVPSGLAKDPS